MSKGIEANLWNSANMSGSVKISSIKDGKEVKSVTTHNTGTIDLCEFIATALTGDYVVVRRPLYILPFRLEGTTRVPIGNTSECIESKVVRRASDWEGYTDPYDPTATDGGFCATRLTFTLPSSHVSGVEIFGFELISADPTGKVYAIVDLDEDQHIITPSGTNLRVEWTIYISYKWDIQRG